MTKKKTKHQGLPVGFRLTNNNKTNIITAVIKKKYGKAIEVMLDREMQLLHCIAEHNIPTQERLRQFQVEYNDFTGNNKTRGDFYSTNSCVYITFTNTTKNKHKLISLSGTEHNRGSFRLGYDYSYGSSVLGSISGFVETPANLQDFYDYMYVSYQRNTTQFFEEDLPEVIRRSVLKLYKDSYKLVISCRELRNKVSSVLQQYSSTTKLCDDLPEMVGIIRLANDVEEFPSRCSDVIEKDKVAELKQLL